MKKISLIIFVFAVLNGFTQQTVGLFINSTSSFDGYTLFTQIGSTKTFLIDNCGHKVKEWNSNYPPGHSVYLTNDGHLLRTANISNSSFSVAGKAGLIEKYDWDNNLIWSYLISTDSLISHHDIMPLPNGNVLAVVWERNPVNDVINAGRNPSFIGNGFLSEKIIEIQPIGTDSGIIVWEWRIFDHLIQNYDITKQNYGVVSDHPELININYNLTANPDWIHMNSVAYNEPLDQIILSAHNFNEIWVIDHSTTTMEASGHTGGNCGKGGDLLYRWGNPSAYGRGALTNGEKKLFGQHDAQWIAQGVPDAGKILIFNNGASRPAGLFSTIEIIDPPLLPDGNYLINSGEVYGPISTDLTYPSVPDLTFYSANISGAQKLNNGNILICEGDNGEFFEVDTMMQIVWKYINPAKANTFISQGTPASGNQVFKVRRYSPDFSGFAGHSLIAGPLLELNPFPDTCVIYTESENLTTSNGNSITVYPNPAIDFVNVVFERENQHYVEIVNVLGEKMISKITIDSQVQIDIHQLEAGFYFLLIDNIVVRKFTKRD